MDYINKIGKELDPEYEIGDAWFIKDENKGRIEYMEEFKTQFLENKS